MKARRPPGRGRPNGPVLVVRAATWRSGEEAHAVPPDIRAAVLARDGHTCRLCGFGPARLGQEILHGNDDHDDHRPDNLLTVCLFCHLCHHCGRAGERGEAVLAWWPELSQAELSHLARGVAVALHAPHSPEEAMRGAMTVLAVAERRSALAAGLLGSSDPRILGQILVEAGGSAAPRGRAILQRLRGLRLWPTGRRRDQRGRDLMPELVAGWTEAEGPRRALPPPAAWPRLAGRLTGPAR